MEVHEFDEFPFSNWVIMNFQVPAVHFFRGTKKKHANPVAIRSGQAEAWPRMAARWSAVCPLRFVMAWRAPEQPQKRTPSIPGSQV